MAWSATKNEIFFQRARNWAASLQNLIEERARLVDLYNNEARSGGVDDPAFVDTAIATKQELIDLAVNVMTPLNNLVNGGTVANVNRVQYLTPFLADQT